jgi:two-component system LytT family response regulator
MRVLIVDDEPLSRRGVHIRLQRHPDLSIIGECGNGIAALERIRNDSPDLVFLDIQMPGLNGLEVMEQLGDEHHPLVIFLTAYDEHALRAFDVQALDYLVKPIDDQRFEQALNRARSQFETSQRLKSAELMIKVLKGENSPYAVRFQVQTGTRIQLVEAGQIDWIGAAGDYSELHVHGQLYLLRETMRSFESSLDPTHFIRIHRSRIIQKSRVKDLRRLDNSEYLIRLADGSEHRSGRTYADRIERWLRDRLSN